MSVLLYLNLFVAGVTFTVAIACFDAGALSSGLLSTAACALNIAGAVRSHRLAT